jgi:hypothetical protein
VVATHSLASPINLKLNHEKFLTAPNRMVECALVWTPLPVGGNEFENSTSGSPPLQTAGDVAKGAAEVGADQAESSDRCHCDQRGNQRVFDSGDATSVSD